MYASRITIIRDHYDLIIDSVKKECSIQKKLSFIDGDNEEEIEAEVDFNEVRDDILEVCKVSNPKLFINSDVDKDCYDALCSREPVFNTMCRIINSVGSNNIGADFDLENLTEAIKTLISIAHDS